MMLQTRILWYLIITLLTIYNTGAILKATGEKQLPLIIPIFLILSVLAIAIHDLKIDKRTEMIK